MILGMGVDIVEIHRLKAAVKKWGDSFLTKIFTPREIKYSTAKRSSFQHFAARFAAKEAVVKAFGEPNKHPIRWTEIEVLNDSEGKPVIEFHNDALKLMKKKRVGDVLVSMSHSEKYAIANVILEGRVK